MLRKASQEDLRSLSPTPTAQLLNWWCHWESSMPLSPAPAAEPWLRDFSWWVSKPKPYLLVFSNRWSSFTTVWRHSSLRALSKRMKVMMKGIRRRLVEPLDIYRQNYQQLVFLRQLGRWDNWEGPPWGQNKTQTLTWGPIPSKELKLDGFRRWNNLCPGHIVEQSAVS